MLKFFKKFFSFSTPVTPVPAPAKKPVPVPEFLLPETAGEFLHLLEEVNKDHEAKYLVISKEKGELEALASELEGQDASPAQKELNRREAVCLRRQAENKKNDSPVSTREIEKKIREEEVRKILDEGVLVLRDERLIKRGGAHGPTPYRWREEIQQNRKVLLYRHNHYLVVSEWFKSGDNVPTWEGERIWATDSVAQFTDEELRAIS